MCLILLLFQLIFSHFAEMLAANNASGTPASEPVAPEEVVDPATAPIKPGRECTIEINKDKMGLGLSIVGGCDTLLVSTPLSIPTGCLFTK